eukprot:sb/3477228/
MLLKYLAIGCRDLAASQRALGVFGFSLVQQPSPDRCVLAPQIGVPRSCVYGHRATAPPQSHTDSIFYTRSKGDSGSLEEGWSETLAYKGGRGDAVFGVPHNTALPDTPCV